MTKEELITENKYLRDRLNFAEATIVRITNISFNREIDKEIKNYNKEINTL